LLRLWNWRKERANAEALFNFGYFVKLNQSLLSPYSYTIDSLRLKKGKGSI
jgi:hypothetical protein